MGHPFRLSVSIRCSEKRDHLLGDIQSVAVTRLDDVDRIFLDSVPVSFNGHLAQEMGQTEAFRVLFFEIRRSPDKQDVTVDHRLV